MKNITILIFGYLVAAGFAYAGDGYTIGDKATDFNLKNVDGNFVSLSDYPDAKGFVVVFTCNHCPYAKAYEGRLIAIDKKYKKKGYPVIAINPNDPEVSPGDSFDKMKERAAKRNFTFPYLFDEEQTIYRKYGATRTPHIYVLDKKGNDLIVSYIGTIDDNYQNPDKVKEKYLAQALDALLAGNEPDPSITRAIGCSIKTK